MYVPTVIPQISLACIKWWGRSQLRALLMTEKKRMINAIGSPEIEPRG